MNDSYHNTGTEGTVEPFAFWAFILSSGTLLSGWLSHKPIQISSRSWDFLKTSAERLKRCNTFSGRFIHRHDASIWFAIAEARSYISGGSRDLGEGSGPPPPPLFWVKIKENLRRKKSRKEKGQKNAYSPSVKGLDSPLHIYLFFFAIPTIMRPINKNIWRHLAWYDSLWSLQNFPVIQLARHRQTKLCWVQFFTGW